VVRNLLGQVVLEQRIGAFGVANSKQRVDISALPKGVYLVQVYEGRDRGRGWEGGERVVYVICQAFGMDTLS
jgi:hypothetical protein